MPCHDAKLHAKRGISGQLSALGQTPDAGDELRPNNSSVQLFRGETIAPVCCFPSTECDARTVAKKLTRDQVQSRKDAAVRFLEDVKDDPDRASEVADESLEDYAERRHVEFIDNPVWSKNPICMKSKGDGSRGPGGADGA